MIKTSKLGNCINWATGPLKILYFCMVLLAAIYIVTAFVFCDLRMRTIEPSEEILILSPYNISQTGEDSYEFDLDIPYPLLSGHSVEFMSSHSDVYVYDDQQREIYAMEAVPSIYGKSSGSKVNFVRMPYGVEQIHIIIHGTFRNSATDNLTFYYGDGVAMMEDLVQNSMPGVCVSTLILAFGIMIVAYWILTHRKINREPTLAYFGIMTIIFGLWAMNETDLMMVLMSNRTIGSMIGYTLLMLVPIPLIGFSKFFLQCEDRFAWTLIALLSLVVFIVLGILHISGVWVFKESVYVIHAVLVLSLGYMVYGVFSRIHRVGMDRRSIVNVIALGVMIISAGLDMGSYYLGMQQTDVWGKVGLLLYIGILSAEALSDAMKQMEEGRKSAFYKEMAVMDIMTGLNNRSAFEDWEEKNPQVDGITLVTFDLNNLKWHNDTLGHAAGDEYIISAAQLIREYFGSYGKCYRIGGDEFCVIVRNKKRFDVKSCIAMLRKGEEKYNTQGETVRMHIACGYATVGTGETLSEARARADEMMYENKRIIKEYNERT